MQWGVDGKTTATVKSKLSNGETLSHNGEPKATTASLKPQRRDSLRSSSTTLDSVSVTRQHSRWKALTMGCQMQQSESESHQV